MGSFKSHKMVLNKPVSLAWFQAFKKKEKMRVKRSQPGCPLPPPFPSSFPPPPLTQNQTNRSRRAKGCVAWEGFFSFKIFLQGARHEITNWY